jgi:hypothetical protein
MCAGMVRTSDTNAILLHRSSRFIVPVEAAQTLRRISNRQ